MALSATFTANFSSFFDAVEKADIKLKDFGAGADKVGGRLNALANSFSGQKIIQDATLMAKAVEEIGGVTKLTEKELARLGATTNEAVAKMKALGMEVPKNLQQIADADQGRQQRHDRLAGHGREDGGGVRDRVLGRRDQELHRRACSTPRVPFKTSPISGASRRSSSSSGRPRPSRAASRPRRSASRSSLSPRDWPKRSPEYDALLRNIGLSGPALRAMKMEDAYREIAKAITAVTDETLQLDVAIGILGPSAKKMIGAYRDGVVEAAEAQKFMSDETIKRLAAAEDAWGKLKNAVVIQSGEMLAAVTENTKRMTSSWGTFLTVVGKGLKSPAEAMAFLEEEAGRAMRGVQGVGRNFDLTAESGQQLTAAIKTTNQVLADNKAKTEGSTKAQQEREKALKKLAAEQDAYNKTLDAEQAAINALMDTFSGRDVIGKAEDYLQALSMSIPVQQMTAAKQADINKVMLAAIEVYEAAGETAPQVMLDLWVATLKLGDAVQTTHEDLSALWRDFGQGPAVNVLELADLIQLDAAPKPGMFDGMAKDLTGAIAASLLRAIEGGGNLFQAAGATIGSYLLDPKQSGIGKAIEGWVQKLPGWLGKMINDVIPVVGPLIGPGIAWLSNKILGFFGKAEHQKLRDSFVAAAGGMGELREAADAAGVSLDKLGRARDTKQMQAAIKEIQDALEAEDFRAAFVTAEGGFERLIVAAGRAGVEVDRLFAARTTDEVTAAIKEIEDALKFQEDAYQLAIETAERYGFTIEELGPAMQRQELDKQAQQLYKDWEILNSAGIDTIAISDKMSESVSKYVQDAMKMGTDVPSAMRPMLEAMAKSGNLLDDNGDAITDLEEAGITFAMTMSEGFQKLIEKVGKLTEAIERSLSQAIIDIPQPVVKGRVEWDLSDLPGVVGKRFAGESFQHGTDGFQNFGSGTPAMLHGWEAVVPRGQGAPAAAGTSIVINAQGAFFDTPDSLQRLANKVSDALTAKYSVMGKLRAAV